MLLDRTIKQLHHQMNNLIKGRIFLVGCPRSGTTLLQSLVSNHSDIASFPESKFYQRLVSSDNKIEMFKATGKRAKETTSLFFQLIENEKLLDLFPKRPSFCLEYSMTFVKALDFLAIQRDCSYWLEKTPAHLHRIELIKSFVPQVKFIHIIRNPIDVIASLYEVNLKYPEIWWQSANVIQCLERWLDDVEITKFYAEQHHQHHIIFYEELIRDSNFHIKKICNFLGIEFQQKMLSPNTDSIDNITRKDEIWKNKSDKIINKKGHEKFDRFFCKEQQMKICQSLSTIDFSFFPENYQESVNTYLKI